MEDVAKSFQMDGHTLDDDLLSIKKLSKDAYIMADIVINHASSKGKWFKNFLKNKEKIAQLENQFS